MACLIIVGVMNDGNRISLAIKDGKAFGDGCRALLTFVVSVALSCKVCKTYFFARFLPCHIQNGLVVRKKF